MRVLSELAADQLRAAEHVRPLVVAAELHVAAVVLEQMIEVVGLHDHVVELQEGQALFHALLVALSTEHVVDGEACADLAQELDIIEVQQPVGVVDHDGFTFAEINESLHLALEALGVVVDILLGQHFAHIGAAGRIADHGRAAADERDGLVARHLQTLHERQRHEMTGSQRICRAVEANVEFGLARVDHFADLRLVRDLLDKASGLQFFINTHCDYSFYV